MGSRWADRLSEPDTYQPQRRGRRDFAHVPTDLKRYGGESTEQANAAALFWRRDAEKAKIENVDLQRKLEGVQITPCIAVAILVFALLGCLMGLGLAGYVAYHMSLRNSILSFAVDLTRTTYGGTGDIWLEVDLSILILGISTIVPFIIAVAMLRSGLKSMLVAFLAIGIFFVIITGSIMMLTLILIPATSSKLLINMGTSLKNNYFGIPYSYQKDNQISLEWDKFMLRNNCCGVNGKADFQKNYKDMASIWHSGFRKYTVNEKTYTMTIPVACCQFNNSDIETLFKDELWAQFPSYMINFGCPVTEMASNADRGCYSLISAKLKAHNLLFGGLYLCVFVLQLISVIIGGCYYSRWSRVHDYQTDPKPATPVNELLKKEEPGTNKETGSKKESGANTEQGVKKTSPAKSKTIISGNENRWNQSKFSYPPNFTVGN